MVEPKEFQDALLAYHARPADHEAEAVRAAVLEQVAAILDKKADDYASEFGHVDHDTNSLEFGSGWRGEVRSDHYNDLRELADEVREMKRTRGVKTCEAPRLDVDAMLAACVPGGSICDPQQVADAIRAYFARGVGGTDVR